MTPLSDIQVVDLSTGVAGPFCTKLFADHGANVIKVEPPEGDVARSFGPYPGAITDREASGIYLYLNSNKFGVTLDIERNQGKILLRELIARADVIVESFQPGYMQNLGFDYDAIEEIKRDAILVSITPFGQTGPWRHYQATDLTEYAASGMSYVNGSPDREPLKEPGFASLYQGGTCGFLGGMSALVYRSVTGEGQHVDVSIQEAAASMFTPQILGSMYSGESPGRDTLSLLPCKDGLVFLNVSHEATWEYMWLFFGETNLVQDPRFTTSADRMKNSQELEELLVPYLARYTMEEIFHGLAPLRVLVSMTLDVGQLVNDTHLQQRRFFIESHHPVAGKVSLPGPPFRMSETCWKYKNPAPMRGQHNEEILCQVLKHSLEDLKFWKENGVV